MSFRPRSLSLLFILLVVAALAACRRGPLEPEQIHAITHKFEAAARSVAGDSVGITLNEETVRGGRVVVAEHLRLVLREPKQAPALREELARVAQANGLIVTFEPGTADASKLFRMVCRSRGRVTHTITAVAEPARVARRPRPSAGQELKAAILIDDLGYDNAISGELFALRYPLNVSVLPGLPHSVEMAEQAHRHGFEVLLHLPMEPLDEVGNHLEPHMLKVGMAPSEVQQIVEKDLAAVPHLAGVNNHQGSRATADPALMDAVMRLLRARGLFFVDSRTTADSVAYDVARRDGVRASYRTVFLDGPQGEPTREYALEKLGRFERKVKEEGWGLAIGHPHHTTLEALREFLPQLERRGIRLVYLSDLVL